MQYYYQHSKVGEMIAGAFYGVILANACIAASFGPILKSKVPRHTCF